MESRLRLVFAGTPDFALPCLETCLRARVDVVAVYTQPDRPAGRGRKLLASPIKQRALARGVAIEQPETLKDPQAQRRLADYAPDLVVVVAYGLILPRRVLAVPRLGCWNLHASLLPRWRGAAPIQRAILAGDTESGVDLMRMEAGLDTGPILIERRTPIADDETGGSLHDRLAALGADALEEGLAQIARGEILAARPQPDVGVVYAHKIEKDEARLDWNESAIALERKVRAFDPWPVAEAEIAGERLRIWSAQAIEHSADAAPGTIFGNGRETLDIACGSGILRILEVQRAGGRRISVRDWHNARREPGAAR
ncbi:MAG TPA: methionyl-tRNA formyltransferase [Rhodanobacteraceae bacterium]|jgi:methionyl-tRNA formyltransferase|nr:methionyl-tRNA formyltransferase [Rhodanobacteraceae bacterium]